MSENGEIFSQRLKSSFKPADSRKVWEWAHEHIYIGERQSQVPGAFSTTITPYCKEPLECFQNRDITDLVMCWGSQTSKALALNTKIPTPNGWSTIGDLIIGDKIFGRDGSIVSVIKTTEVFYDKECYEIEIGTGEKIVADAGHLWCVSQKERLRGYSGTKRVEFSQRIEKIVETKDICFKSRMPMRFPVCEAIKTDAKNLPIHPYVLGAWLGDGHSAGNRITIHSKETKILDKIKEFGFNFEVKNIKGDALTAAIDSRPFGKRKDNEDRFYVLLKKNNLLKNKHIPEEYYRSSIEQRLDLVRGLMDTDGSCTIKGRCTFVSTKEHLTSGLSHLLASLGIKSKIRKIECKINGIKVSDGYLLEFNPNNFNVFYLDNKLKRIRSVVRSNFVKNHEIKSIKRVKSVPVKCIGVDSKDNLFLCGESFLPTHNTTTIMVGATWRIKHAPTPILWVMPNSDLAQSFSENRWIPLIEESKTMNEMKPKDKNLFKKLEQQFQRCTLTFVGSNSPANLASRPAGLLIMDEIDKFAQASGKESSALQLAENRTKSFTSPLKVKTSTPTTEHGEIWKEFQKGDMRYYHVPCPHCQKEIKLIWSQVKWAEDAKNDDGKWNLEKVKISTYYECQGCKGKITDSHKTSMLRKGRWIPSNDLAEFGRRSYHLNSLYAPWRSCNFGNLAVQFLQAKETMNGLQDFINGALAEPWNEDASFERKEDAISEYDPLLPWEAESKRFLTVDVQESHFWAVARQWSAVGESRLLWEGKLLTFDDIADKQSEWNIPGKCVVLDIAHRTNEVSQEIVRRGWMGLWGDPGNRRSFTWTTKKGTRLQRLFSPPQRRDAYIGTSNGNRFFAAYFFWCGNPVKDLFEKIRRSKSPGWHIYGNVSDDYKWQIDAEVRKLRRNPRTGAESFEWYQSRRDNHLRDCELMQVVCALIANLVNYKPEEELEESPLTQ